MNTPARTALALVVATATAITSASALARGYGTRAHVGVRGPVVPHGYGHGYGHGWYGGSVRYGVYFGAPWYGWPGYYYGAPYYYPPAVVTVPVTPPTYVEQDPVAAPPAQSAPAAPQPGYWYYCADAGAYYPYVKECPGGWQRVSPQPTPG